MTASLNFGPSEQTPAQCQLIAQRALALLLAEDDPASGQLEVLQERYVAGEVDLYAISVHVRSEVRQKLEALLQETAD